MLSDSGGTQREVQLRTDGVGMNQQEENMISASGKNQQGEDMLSNDLGKNKRGKFKLPGSAKSEKGEELPVSGKKFKVGGAVCQ
jgi:hypothetical protein